MRVEPLIFARTFGAVRLDGFLVSGKWGVICLDNYLGGTGAGGLAGWCIIVVDGFEVMSDWHQLCFV